MKRLIRRSSRKKITLVGGATVLVVLCLITQTSQGTTAGFNASINNSTNTAGTATYFTCTAAVAANASSEVFAFKLNEASTATTIAPDAFTGTAGTLLQSHTGDSGTTWAKHQSSDSDAVLTATGRLRKAGTLANSESLYYSSALLASANYTVSADVYVATSIPTDDIGVAGRINSASNTFYFARYEQSGAQWTLFSVVNGTFAYLGGAVQNLAVGSTSRLSLDMNGSTIRLLVNNTQLVSVSNTSIAAAGAGGVLFGYASNSTAVDTDTTGMQLDNFAITLAVANPAAADFSGHNAAGTYQGSMLSSATPANAGCPRDTGGAYLLNGSTSYVSTPTQIANPTTFSVEIWFKSTVPSGKLIGFGNAQTGSSGNYDRHLYFSTTGQIIFGVYSGVYHTITSPAAYTDGNWHQAVASLSAAGMILYMDGRQVAADPTTTTAQNYSGYWRIGYDNINGWPTTGTNYYFTGNLRFAAVYTIALTASQVATDYNAGK